MSVRVFVTGGTFDKEYDELTGKLFFKDTHVDEMLRRGRCGLEVDVETLMMVDSLDMTEDQRRTIVLTGAMVPYAFGSSDGLSFSAPRSRSCRRCRPASISR